MKYLYVILALLMSSLAFSACGDKNEDNDPSTEIEEEQPTPRPTWELPGNLHYSSMTVVLDDKSVPKGVGISTDDLLGAFVDDQCRGFAAPVVDVDNQMRCILVINSTTSDFNNNDLKVELRYYSAQKAKLYVSKTFPFEYDGRLGSISKSFVPEWK